MNNIEKDIEFVGSILPYHYDIKESSKRRGSICCSSNTGIIDDVHWDFIMKSFRSYFGLRLSEVYHNTNHKHSDFVIHLRDVEATPYVVGFAFSRDKKDIVLIEKQKPDWQKGKFNGIGGKINNSETPLEAMVREFKEETGAETEQSMWSLYATLRFEKAILHCFRMFSNVIYQCKTVEQERVVRLAIDTAMGEFSRPIIANLKVLIPMALDEEFQFADIQAVVR